MTGSPGFLDTVLKLMNFGAAGIGVIVMLFVFFIVVRGKQTDPGTLDLSKMLLRYGLGFATACAFLAFVTPLLAPAPLSKPPEMLLSFSPSFTSEKLPSPDITLPDGNTISEGKVFKAQDGQVLVRMDNALKAVKELKTAVANLAETANKAQKQADQAVTALSGSAEGNGAVTHATSQAITASKESQLATASVLEAAKRGDYADLAKANRALGSSARDSFEARSAVISRVGQ